MNQQPIDFQGMINLDQKIVHQLEHYLQEKETRLAMRLLHAVQVSPEELSTPKLASPTEKTSLKLSDGVEKFNKAIRTSLREMERGGPKKGEKVAEEVNKAFWEFTEVLEGCVTELFQQIQQIPINHWHFSISPVVRSIKDLLIHHLEDTMWAIRRLEKPIEELERKHQKQMKNWRFWETFWQSSLNSDLMDNLTQTEKFLKDQYESFNRSYLEYMHLSSKIEQDLQGMKTHPILALLDVHDQNLYVDTFRLLKILEVNRQPKKGVGLETIKALKHLTSVDQIVQLFRLYNRELKQAFFSSSLEWKALNHQDENFTQIKDRLKNKISDYQRELQHLIHTIRHFRFFILKTDANPYTRSRWGFTEWSVGPEPPQAKHLLSLIYTTEELDDQFDQLIQVLNRDLVNQDQQEEMSHKEIERLLHEMGQPLISRSMMRHRAELFLKELKHCDEIGSSHLATINFVEESLSKAMRADWKYHVLHEFSLFHQLYHLHQGIAEHFEDPSHAFRLDHFHRLFDQIQEWVAKGDIYSHVHEIELDINDMKSYLQDFLASIQRIAKERPQDPFLDATIRKFRQHLLEYRYLFGQFFSTITNKSTDGQQLRNQFLFVDQYFESAENLLNELKTNAEKKS
jgi:hypothetical protein